MSQFCNIGKGDKMTDEDYKMSALVTPLCSQRKGQNHNPLYIDYYSHRGCYCYKIDLPWSKYWRHTVVLCDVSEGFELAKKRAVKVIAEHLKYALEEPN